MKVSVAMLSSFVLVAAISTAQTTSAPAKPAVTVRSGQMGGGAAGFAVGVPVVGNIIPGHPAAFITGRPYSAEQITERVQTLADGTHISQTVSKINLYRDSQGRSRMEHSFVLPPGAQGSAPTFVTIVDPVAGYQYTFDTRQHTARRISMSPPPHQTSQWFHKTAPANRPNVTPFTRTVEPNATAPQHPSTQRESLGTQTIEGISAEGTRMTTTFPVGSVGNDREFTTTSETWMSKDLGVTVLSKNSDPRYGETTTRLTDISQTEPDPNLFLVPPDYTIVDPQQTPVQ